MKRKDLLLMAALVAISGFIGGAVTSWLILGNPAFAQNRVISAETVQAQGFELVDKNGNLFAKLSFPNMEPEATAKGPDRATPQQDPFLIFFDRTGKITWSAPPQPGPMFVR